MIRSSPCQGPRARILGHCSVWPVRKLAQRDGELACRHADAPPTVTRPTIPSSNLNGVHVASRGIRCGTECIELDLSPMVPYPRLGPDHDSATSDTPTREPTKSVLVRREGEEAPGSPFRATRTKAVGSDRALRRSDIASRWMKSLCDDPAGLWQEHRRRLERAV